MEKIWYNISGAPERLIALYDDDIEIMEGSFKSNLIGYVNRNKDGSWSAFGPMENLPLTWLGNQPNKIYAMEMVADIVNNDPRSEK